MKWFKHDTNAHQDAKLERVIMRYGIEGYGLYFYCVEIIAGTVSPENINFELEHDAELLAYKLKMDTLRVEEIMRYCVELGLFEINDKSRITCAKLAKRLDNNLTQNKQLKETLRNFKSLKADETRRDIEETREEERVDTYPSEFPQDFEEFCKAYPKHVEKGRTYTQYKAVMPQVLDPSKLVMAAENYARHVKDEGTEVKYIKAAHNFLKDTWRDYLEYKKARDAPKGVECPVCHKTVAVLVAGEGKCMDCLRSEMKGA